jgi:hypothetical protein
MRQPTQHAAVVLGWLLLAAVVAAAAPPLDGVLPDSGGGDRRLLQVSPAPVANASEYLARLLDDNGAGTCTSNFEQNGPNKACDAACQATTSAGLLAFYDAAGQHPAAAAAAAAAAPRGLRMHGACLGPR